MKTPLRSLSNWRAATRTLGLAALACGTADIAFVILGMLVRGHDPLRMLQSIAYSVLGPATYAGGLATSAFGLALHYGVALGAAVHFALVAWFVRPAVRHPLAAGVLFGVYFYFLMQLVVLPLTLIPVRTALPPQWWVQLIAHATCVGAPLALVLAWREQQLARAEAPARFAAAAAVH